MTIEIRVVNGIDIDVNPKIVAVNSYTGAIHGPPTDEGVFISGIAGHAVFSNAVVFNADIEGNVNDVLKITLSRNMAGFLIGGRINFLIRFDQPVTINGEAEGFLLDPTLGIQGAEPGHLFLLNLTVFAPLSAVEVTQNGEGATNNDVPRYIARGESLDFYIEISTCYRNPVLRPTPLIFATDPDTGEMITGAIFSNALFFDTQAVLDGNVWRVTVTRNDLYGFIQDGRVQFVVWFDRRTLINGEPGGYTWYYTRQAVIPAPVLSFSVHFQGHLFLINLTVAEPQP